MRIKTDIITKTARQYRSQSLWVLCTLTIIGLLYIQIQGRFELIKSLIISILFNLFCSIAYGQTWKAIARRSPENLPKFYLAWSAMRLMAAAILLLIYCVIVREIVAIKWFAVIFIVCYIVMLVFDSWFFIRVSKKRGFIQS